jgi:hypothetical protein
MGCLTIAEKCFRLKNEIEMIHSYAILKAYGHLLEMVEWYFVQQYSGNSAYSLTEEMIDQQYEKVTGMMEKNE